MTLWMITAVSPPFCTEKFEDRDYGDCGNPLWLTMTIFLVRSDSPTFTRIVFLTTYWLQ